MRIVLGATPDFRLLAEADNGEDGIREMLRTQPDLVLLDVFMPGMSGLDALPHIRKAAPRAQVAVLSMSNNREDRRTATQRGAHAFIDKSTPTSELLERLRCMCQLVPNSPQLDS
jgi:DNA-binding NarL/FixJ family response regulator